MKERTSKIHSESLKTLVYMWVKKDIKVIKSTDLNQIVNVRLRDFIHPSNFRESMKRLEKRGFIMRHKVDFDWYVSVTETGYEYGYDLLSS